MKDSPLVSIIIPIYHTSEFLISALNSILSMNFFDYEGLARNVDILLDSPSLRDKLGKNARRFAIENYDLNTVCLPRQIEWVNNL